MCSTLTEKLYTIKTQALYDNKPEDAYFLDEILLDKKMIPVIQRVCKVHKLSSRHKPGSKFFNFKLGKAMIPFIDEYVKKYVHRHLIIQNVIIMSIENYWKNKPKEVIEEMIPLISYDQIMKDLDILLNTSIPSISKQLEKLNYKPRQSKVEEVIEPKVTLVEPKVVLCKCNRNETFCFCWNHLKKTWVR